MAAVTFDYKAWAARYPELSRSVTDVQAQAYFNEACLYCDNTECSPVRDDSVGGQRSMFLNMITAHIAALNASANGVDASPLVGRIASATEGSVTVQTDNQYPPGGAQWFQQTKYGAAFFAASAQFRTMFRVPGYSRPADPYRRY